MNAFLQINRLSSFCFAALFAVALLLPSQAEAQIRLGAAYGTDTEIGVTAGFFRPVTAQGAAGLSVGFDGTFYLPETNTISGSDYTSTFFELNANAHYPISNMSSGSLYALGGVQYAHASVETPFGDATSSDIGLNLGAGMNFGRLFAEAKYAIGGFEQLVLSAGLSF